MRLLRDLRGYKSLRTGSRSLCHPGFEHGAFNGHGFRDRGPFDLGF
jgi:hypothetical protein